MDDFFSGPSACLARLEEYYSTHEKKCPDDPMHNPYNWSQGMDGKVRSPNVIIEGCLTALSGFRIGIWCLQGPQID